MATSVNWISGVISIPRADMPVVQVSPEIRELDINALRLELRDLEDDPDGRPWTKTHSHNTVVTLSGTSYARSVIFIAPYTVTFEDGQYTVKTKGANHNLLDVKNANQVSVITENSAGLIDAAVVNAVIDSIDLKTDLIAFQGGVAYDSQGFTGTGIAPNGQQIGTRSAPSSELDSIISILLDKGLNEIFVTTSLINTTSDFSEGYTFIGDLRLFAFLSFANANVERCTFRNLTLQGVFDSFISARLCDVQTITNVSGSFHQCYFKGSITIINEVALTECYAKGSGFIIIPNSEIFTFNDFHGPVTVSGMTGGTSIIEVYGGTVTVDNTCTGGTLTVIGGPYELIDNSNGTVVIDNTGDIKTSGTFQNSTNDTKKIEEMHGQISRSVWIDTENPVNGDGYQQTPFNNFTDAVDYAEANGLTNLKVLADATIDRQLKNFVITGVGTPTIDTNGQNLDKSEIMRCSLTGAYTGRIVAQECDTVGLFTLNGFFERCAFSADVLVPSGGLALVKDCNSFITGTTPPQIDIGGVAGTAQLVVTGFDGGMRIVNVNQVTDDVKFLTHVGRVIVDASCTLAENINVGGVTVLVNESAGVPVDVTLDPFDLQDSYAALYNRRLHDKTADTVTLYEPDNVTVKQVWDAPDDLSELTPQ